MRGGESGNWHLWSIYYVQSTWSTLLNIRVLIHVLPQSPEFVKSHEGEGLALFVLENSLFSQ